MEQAPEEQSEDPPEEHQDPPEEQEIPQMQPQILQLDPQIQQLECQNPELERQAQQLASQISQMGHQLPQMEQTTGPLVLQDPELDRQIPRMGRQDLARGSRGNRFRRQTRQISQISSLQREESSSSEMEISQISSLQREESSSSEIEIPPLEPEGPGDLPLQAFPEHGFAPIEPPNQPQMLAGHPPVVRPIPVHIQRLLQPENQVVPQPAERMGNVQMLCIDMQVHFVEEQDQIIRLDYGVPLLEVHVPSPNPYYMERQDQLPERINLPQDHDVLELENLVLSSEQGHGSLQLEHQDPSLVNNEVVSEQPQSGGTSFPISEIESSSNMRLQSQAPMSPRPRSENSFFHPYSSYSSSRHTSASSSLPQSLCEGLSSSQSMSESISFPLSEGISLPLSESISIPLSQSEGSPLETHEGILAQELDEISEQENLPPVPRGEVSPDEEMAAQELDEILSQEDREDN